MRPVRDGNGFAPAQMKRTEIIIETQRVTVIRRRRPSNQAAPAGLPDMQIIDIADGKSRASADEELDNNEIQGEERDACTDSRDR
jgi:hypothetical protein